MSDYHYFLVAVTTYAVESSDALSPVYLHQAVAHAAVVLVALAVDDVVVLQAESRLHDPDGIGHEKGENAGLTGGKHVQCRSQRLRCVSALNPSFDCVVAVERRLVPWTRLVDPVWTYNKK